MFTIAEKQGSILMQLTAGDSAEIQTEPFLDINSNDSFDSDEQHSVVLADTDKVLFTVTTQKGQVCLKKILTNSNYNEDNILVLKLKPQDTINLKPNFYLFSFAYLPNEGEERYTYAQGVLKLLPSLAK